MNTGRFLDDYERIANVRDGISRLRRFILDLAVREKVAPQDPSDEPASELLKRVGVAKTRQVVAGKTKADVARIGVEEIPFVLPPTWTWVRVGDLFEYDAGIKREPKELLRDRWLLELEDLEKDTSFVIARLRVEAIGLAQHKVGISGWRYPLWQAATISK